MHRVTFSKTLAEHIVETIDDGFEVKRFTFQIGRRLELGEQSKSGLYALLSTKADRVLRIALNKDIAELLCDYDSRYLAECWLVTM